MEHRGEIVSKVLREYGVNKTELSRKLEVSKQTLYNQLKNPYMNRAYILRIGDILGHDFSLAIPSLRATSVREAPKGQPGPLPRAEVTVRLDGTEELLQDAIGRLTSINNLIRGS